MSYIKIEAITKSYHDRRSAPRKNSDKSNEIRVLDNINLEFKEGEMVCILGPSGCGKSTLLRMIAGFDSPTSGQVTIHDKAVTGPSDNNIFVFQHSGLLPWMTVWDNVILGVRHLPEEEKNERAQEYIDIVDLSGFEHHYPHQLSGGMLRRAELARAVAVQPEMLIMDEPFSGLDFLTHMKIREELVNMHEFLGQSMLIVTHDIDDALIMGDRIIVLSSRPSQVKLERTLSFDRPRDLSKIPELSELRDELYFMLGVSYAV
ncbi:MAG: ATP-binding cassette domain-containing protein [Methyloprofundus sp.]|nr:ATP-binding cassette domain-containing protein [Methyloprofundus sp.]